MKSLTIGAIVTVGLIGAAAVYYFYFQTPEKNAGALKRVEAEVRNVTVSVQSTGVVEPENKVAILPPVAGRIDELLVSEGDSVRRGQKVAMMSSTNRAALVDLAKSRTSEERRLLEDTYRPTAVFAPVAGQIISRLVVPGQTIGQTTVLFELSDRLVVRAEVDETDLAGIQFDMEAEVTVDAFRDLTLAARVLRIAHQSKLVNNVNVYDVLLALKSVPGNLRSGMTANVNFIKDRLTQVVTLPNWALQGGDGKTANLHTETGEVVTVTIGPSDGQFTKIDGLKAGEAIYVKELSLQENNNKSMFGPRMPRRPAGGHP